MKGKTAMKEGLINTFINYSNEINRVKNELDCYKSINSDSYKDYVLNVWTNEPEAEFLEDISLGFEIIERSKLTRDNTDYVFDFRDAAHFDFMLNELITMSKDYIDNLLKVLLGKLQKYFNQ